MNPAELIAFLVELRKQSGLSQTALAQRCGVSSGTISLWKSRERHPPVASIISWGDALGVTISFSARPNAPEAEGVERWTCAALAMEVIETAPMPVVRALRTILARMSREPAAR